MNIAQMAMFQMQRIGAGKSGKSLTGIPEQSFNKGKSGGDVFSRVLGNTIEKDESSRSNSSEPRSSELRTSEFKSSESKSSESKSSESKSSESNSGISVKSKNEQQKPVKEPTIPDSEADSVNTEDETGDVTDKPEATGSHETDRMLLLQLADLLKLLGISINEKGTLSGAGGLSGELGNQQDQAPTILQEPGLREAVVRLVKMLEGLSVNGKNGDAAPFLKELKNVIEAQAAELNSPVDEKSLIKLVKDVEKILSKSSVEKSGTVSPVMESEKLSPVAETVSETTDASKTAEAGSAAESVNSKDSEQFGSDTAQDSNNGFNLDHSEVISLRGDRPGISGHSLANFEKALGNEQAGQIPKMTQNIFGQIAQKAKVIALPGVTEMQIQLKPGVLGKLNMSIISENGSVTARFTAETQTVKGIIEANLNSLKDTLNQQGIKVDQLVVDIGTHNHQPGFEQRQNMYQGNKGSKNNRISLQDDEVERIFSAESQSRAQKSYYGSTVEFTA